MLDVVEFKRAWDLLTVFLRPNMYCQKVARVKTTFLKPRVWLVIVVYMFDPIKGSVSLRHGGHIVRLTVERAFVIRNTESAKRLAEDLSAQHHAGRAGRCKTGEKWEAWQRIIWEITNPNKASPLGCGIAFDRRTRGSN